MQSITGPSCFKVNNWAKSKSITGPRTCSRCKNRGFRFFFFFAQLSLCVCVFLCPIICQFSKNNLFFQKKRPQKLGFSSFCVLSLNFENYLFLGLLKHYKNRVSANCCVFCCCKRRKRQKKKYWNFWIWFFWSKNGRFVTQNCFPQNGLLKPLFL